MRKTKTNEMFLHEIEGKNNKINIIGNYINAKTKVAVECKKCGHKWEALPSNLLKGHGCGKCRNTKIKEKNTKTQEEFIKELVVISPNIIVLGKYINARTKIKCECKVCGKIWSPIPDSLVRGHGCPRCSAKDAGDKMRKSHDEFVKELYQINSDVEIIGRYYNAKQNILCKCKIHNVTWETQPAHLLNGTGCPKCKKVYRRSQNEFIKEVYNICGDEYTVLGEFKTTREKILMRHNECGNEYYVKPSKFLTGRRCPACFASHKKTKEQFALELSEVNSDIEVIGEYTDYHTNIKVKCKICGSTWDTAPATLMRGSGCPECKASNGEQEVSRVLKKHNFKYFTEYRFNDCRNQKPLPFDFYLPDKNVCIEYDGVQHFKPSNFFIREGYDFNYRKRNDKIKNNYCKEKNIKLIRIPYTIENIEEYLQQQLSIS